MIRVLARISLATLGLAFVPTPASAATLPFTATLSVQVGTLPGAVFTGSGVAQSNGLGGSFTLPSNFLSGSVVFPASLVGVPGIYKIIVTVTGNGAGSFNPSFSPPLLHSYVNRLGGSKLTPGVSMAGGGIGGAMPIAGGAGVNLFGAATAPIPLSVVGSGSTALTNYAGIIFQVVASQWTTGVARMLAATEGTYHLPNSVSVMISVTVTTTGSDARTPGGRGTVTLVSPVKVMQNLGEPNLAAVTRLTVNFIPEPGTAVLLAAGIVALAARGSRRRREPSGRDRDAA